MLASRGVSCRWDWSRIPGVEPAVEAIFESVEGNLWVRTPAAKLLRAAKAHTGSRLDADEVAQLVYDLRELYPDESGLYSPPVEEDALPEKEQPAP